MSNTSNAEQEAIDAFVPQTRDITIDGKPHTVRSLETRQIWPILRCGLPIIEGLAALIPKASSPDAPPAVGELAGPVLDVQPKSNLDSLIGADMATFVRVMAEHGERVTEIIATALDIKVSEAGKADPLEAYLAAKAIVEINRDFFTHRLGPLLGQIKMVDEHNAGLAERMGLAIPGVGPIASSS